jgi:hypothetical protein
MDQRLQVIARQRDFAIARWTRVNMMFWRRQVTVEGLLAAEKNHDEIARDYGKVIGLSVIGDVLALPDTAARHHSARFMQSNANTQLCAAVIIEGESLLSMTARGIARALQLLSRTGFPFEVFSTPKDASRWCSEHFAANPLWADELCTAIEACKQELHAPDTVEPADPHDRPTRP